MSLLSRGALPAVVGQLLAGVVLGRTLLDVVHPADPPLLLLYDVGFATLMFTVGMHVPLHDRRLRAALAGRIVRRGGVAGNISFGLARLGLDPVLVGAVGTSAAEGAVRDIAPTVAFLVVVLLLAPLIGLDHSPASTM